MERPYFKIIIGGFWLFSLVLGAGISAAQARSPLANTQCPVMKGEAAKQKFSVHYKGQLIHLCCKSCIRRFNKDPEKYFARLPQFVE